jgi:glycerophosphoryl diester phosphodiesterase
MSFSWMSLRRCLEMAPGLEMVYLMERVPLRFRDGTLPLGASAAGPSIDIVLAHPEYVDKVHAAGNDVHVWTVNNPVDIELCAALGVEAIISDKPGDALRQLQARRS